MSLTGTTLFGLQTFGGGLLTVDGEELGDALTQAHLVTEGAAAEAAGADAFGVGEHHRAELPTSAPDVILAGVAARTERILLTTAVTVLSTDDPVRAYERYATVDGISGGRVQPVLGRASFTEPFPLFGFDLAHYNELFEEKLALWTQAKREGALRFNGVHRAALNGERAFPASATPGGIVTWVGVGGSPESVVRAAKYNANLMMAGLGQTPDRIQRYFQLFRAAEKEFGQRPAMLGMTSNGFLADTMEEARDRAWETNRRLMESVARERGWGERTREHFEADAETGFSLVGTPEWAAQRIAEHVLALDVDRYDVNYGNMTATREEKLEQIRLWGEVVFPRVRELVAEARATAGGDAAPSAAAATVAADTTGDVAPSGQQA
ncbi:LLM class flavin-dependent oxidoreductase [Galactobacter valiniphilus]|uniref:LLM class flavin-dependent oxidoreductase n=1 Tax=Galactobacter valiniphilus TaxID=2676122 RepID=UPI003734CC9C